jgi:hexosaminidase
MNHEKYQRFRLLNLPALVNISLIFCLTLQVLSAQVISDSYARSNLFQLADPIILVDSLLFQKNSSIQAILDYPSAQLYYTTDESEPTQDSPTFPASLIVDRTTQIKVKAFHPDLQPSNTVATSLLKILPPPPIASIQFKYPAHKNYPGNGAASMLDGKKGSLNFREPHWSGFQDHHLEIVLRFEKPIRLSSVTASVLSDQASWIFPPVGLSVLSSTDGEEFELIAKKDIPVLAKEAPSALLFPRLSFPPQLVQHLIIIVENTGEIPVWHQGKGTPAWLFVDELILDWTLGR